VKERLAAVLEAFAVGDAMGMPTEFMTRLEIQSTFGLVSRLLEPEESKNHRDLPRGSITDDTEQNLYLLKAYCEHGLVSCDLTASTLLRWVQETDAVAKKYIGPSSLRALKAIQEGMDPRLAGRSGTTCGGLMRTLAAVFCTRGGDGLLENIVECLIPTHYTSQALEAAGAYGFALRAALEGCSIEEILQQALLGAQQGMDRAPYIACAASSAARIHHVVNFVPGTNLRADPFLDHLYGVLGTGLESADVCAAVFALFLFAKEEVWLAIQLGASVGGDTDTIAALAGALCAAYAGSHNIPAEVLKEVVARNSLDLPAVAARVVDAFGTV
jgi:ADP-ribosylglycohydrolase